MEKFVLQLVQALKFERHTDNPLSRLLLHLANHSDQVGRARVPARMMLKKSNCSVAFYSLQL